MERKSESLLFCGTAGIPSEITICAVNSLFQGTTFFGNSQPYVPADASTKVGDPSVAGIPAVAGVPLAELGNQ
jgi:hypothetical protein